MTDSLPILPLVLFALAAVLIVVGGIWFLVAGFREHFLWGLAILVVPLVPTLVFTCLRWHRAKLPFLISLTGTLLFGAAVAAFPKDALAGEFTQWKTLAASATTSSPPELSLDEIGERAAELKNREKLLLQEKARLIKGDVASATALKSKIDQYNADREALVNQPGYPMWKLTREQALLPTSDN